MCAVYSREWEGVRLKRDILGSSRPGTSSVVFFTAVAITCPSASGVWILSLSPHPPAWLTSYT